MVFVRQVKEFVGPFCRDCGMHFSRKTQAHNLGFGWWGLISFVTNPFTIAKNAASSRRVRALTPPTGTALAAPFSPGRPVWQRPQLLGAAAVVAFFTIGIVTETTTASGNDLAVGDCINIPTSNSFDKVDLRPCDEPHDAEVVGFAGALSLPASSASGDHPCIPIGAQVIQPSKFDVTRVGVIEWTRPGGNITSVCLAESLDGTPLNGRVGRT